MHLEIIPFNSIRVLEKNRRKLSSKHIEKNIIVAKDILDKISREEAEISSVSSPS